MSTRAGASRRSVGAVLGARLRARRSEIERAVLTRAHAVSEPTEVTDPTYADGLRAAISAALDYGLDGIERAEHHDALAVPVALLAQARLAARSGVSLDTVLRRYFAGYALLGDYLIEEAQNCDVLEGHSLKRLLRAQSTLFDRLLNAVSEEYAREAEARGSSAEERRAHRVERLLAGELLDTGELQYDFDAHHLGAVAQGPGAPEAIRDLAAALDRRFLAIRRDRGIVWAWFGGRHRLDPADLERLVSATWPPQVLFFALGEPIQGLDGWRLTHRQARAALLIASRSSKTLVRYADVALVASLLQDDLLSTSLRQLYLAPLSEERDGGKAARETLRAYFAAGRNAASAAAALGVNRQTITNRLRAIESRLGRQLSSCAPEIESALRLAEIGHPDPS